MNTKQDNQPTEITPFDDNPAPVLDIQTALPPVTLRDIKEKMGILVNQVPAASLVGQTFTILHGKKFPSTFPTQSDPYYCVVAMQDTGEKVGSVFGGGACVEILDALAAAQFQNPLTVTLIEKQGGKFGRYYVFE